MNQLQYFKNILKLILFLSCIILFSTKTTAQENALLADLLNKMNGIQSLRANITINNTITGNLSYKRPNLLHVKLADGRIISANGKILWFYSPNSAIAGKQDLSGSTAGLSGLFTGYENVKVTGNTILLKSPKRYYEEITVVVDSNHLLKALRLKNKNQNYTNLSFSNYQINVGLSSNLFNLHPPASAQVIENPLNEKE